MKMLKQLRVGLIQCTIGKFKNQNLANAAKMISIAKENGAQLVALPEYFNTPFGPKYFDLNSETVPGGPTSEMLSLTAKKYAIYIIGGSYPERCNNKIYNTCTVWNPNGELIAKYRKIHLLNIKIPDIVEFNESQYITAGNELVTFNIMDVKVGLGICNDLKFDELATLYKIKKCKLLIYPGGFMLETGPLYWKVFQRARALDNNMYVCGISPARNNKGFIAWGHSQITDPNGRVMAESNHGEEIVYGDLDFTKINDEEDLLTNFNKRRIDIYETIEKSNKKV